ncbi:hypothetical protein SM007_29300 [Streptomyces avermitilis]|nr:hypothetical protein SM007_29300 [Streptomyces avermitilis]
MVSDAGGREHGQPRHSRSRESHVWGHRHPWRVRSAGIRRRRSRRRAHIRARAGFRHDAVADCLASTTTLWLTVYGAGAALLVGLGAWFFDRTRPRRETAVGTRSA